VSKAHDSLFKVGFASKEAAQSQLRALLPADLLAAMDLDSLEVRPSDLIDAARNGLRETPCDRLYAVRLREREALVYVLHEHQSTPDPLMSYRLLRYMLRIWERWLEAERQRTGRRPVRLPAIVPVVLYHGVKAWNVPQDFLDLIDLPPESLPAARKHLPSFEFVLDDLSQRSDAELRARGAPALASITLLLFKHGRRGEDLVALWRSFADLLRELAEAQDWAVGLEAVARYTHLVGEVRPAALSEIVEAAMGQDASEVVETTGERLIREGREQGVLEGERRVLLRLLRRRFGAVPADLELRVAGASQAKLDAWADRVLDAETLDAVFSEPA
jgi:predicted transposase YdaD